MPSAVPRPSPGVRDCTQVESLEPHGFNWNILAPLSKQKGCQGKPGCRCCRVILPGENATPLARNGAGGQAQKFPAPSEFAEDFVPTLVIGMVKNMTARLPDRGVGQTIVGDVCQSADRADV